MPILISINSENMNVLPFHENFTMLSKILKIMTHMPLVRKGKQCKLALLWIKVKIPFFNMCKKTWGRIRMSHCFDANPDPDLDRHQNGKSYPDPQHWLEIREFSFVRTFAFLFRCYLGGPLSRSFATKPWRSCASYRTWQLLCSSERSTGISVIFRV